MYNARRDRRKNVQIESLEVRQMLAANYLYSLTPRPGVATEGFGWSQAASEDYHVVGNPYTENQPENGFVGEIQVHDADTGALLRTIANPDPNDLYRFGYSVDVFADWIVVGAVGWPNPEESNVANGYSDQSGRAYLFDASSGNLLYRFDGTFMTGRGSSENFDQFGNSVSIDGNYVVVGAPGNEPYDTADDDAGHAYVFSAVTGALLHMWENPEPEASNGGLNFGYTVSTSDGKVAISNQLTSTYGTGTANYGKSYVYDAASGNLLKTLLAPDGPGGTNLGFHVAIDGNVVAVNAGENSDDVVYIFDATTGMVTQKLLNSTLPDVYETQVATSVFTLGVPATLGKIINAGSGAITSVIDPPLGGGSHWPSLTLFDDRVLVGRVEGLGPDEVLVYEIVSNEPPTDIALSDNMIAETPANGTIVGALTASDPDFGETFTFSLSDSAGGRFTVSGSNVVVADGLLLDYEANTSHIIEVMATDSGGNSITRQFTIIVLKTVYGTAGDDAFVLTYSSIQLTGVVNVTISTGGGPVIDLGDIPMTAPLLVDGLGGIDSVEIRTTVGGDTIFVNGSGLTVNGATLFLKSIENRTLAAGAGDDQYLFDADVALETYTLDESAGGVDTIDFTATTTALTLDLALTSVQVVNPNVSLRLTTPAGFEGARGGAGNDTLLGNAADNILTGQAGHDTLKGRAGNDTYVFGTASSLENDFVVELPNQGVDTLDFSALSTNVTLSLNTNGIQSAHTNRTVQLNQFDTFENLIGGAGNDALNGNNLANTLTGNAGNDVLSGLKGDDLLIGNEGNDTLFGHDGSDSHFGGAGNDVYYPGAISLSAETDNLVELPGEGIDGVSFFFVTGPVTFSLAIDTAQSAHLNRMIQLNSVSTFENLFGGNASDTLSGNDLANEIFGGTGNDTLSGGVGSDVLQGQQGNDTYIFATASSLENDFVSELPNQGTDTLDFSALSTNVTLSLNTNGIQSAHTNRTVQLNQFATFENLIGGSGNDTLTGNSLANTLTGNAGNDFLTGNDGSDNFFGGIGDDGYYTGVVPGSTETDSMVELPGEGTDSVVFAFVSQPVTLSLAVNMAQSAHLNRMILLNSGSTFENLYGGGSHDTLIGNELANQIFGGTGNDTLSGGVGNDVLQGQQGNDTYIFATASSLENDFVSEQPNQGVDTLDFSALSTNVTLSLNTNGIQSAHTNRTVQLNQNAAFENLIGGSGNDTLTGNGLSNTLTGNSGDDILVGGAGDDQLLGNAGQDILKGDAGSDSLIGGSGDDGYHPGVVPISAETDNFLELAGEGIDGVWFNDANVSVTFSLAIDTAQAAHANRMVQLNSGLTFERLLGGSSHDSLSGNDLANEIFGGSGNDTLSAAGGGNDILNGGLGDDTYRFFPALLAEFEFIKELPNQGIDTLDFSALSTNVTLSLNTNGMQPAHTNRTVQLNQYTTFENLIGGAGNDSLLGNDLGNALTGGPGSDALNGLGGSDVLSGGLDSDTYAFVNAASFEADSIIELDNQGQNDKVVFGAVAAGVTLNLDLAVVQPIHLNRTLQLSSGNAIETVLGGPGNDVLTGNSLGNFLSGVGGNDTLNGAGGGDSLFGGLGNDTYVFTTATVAELDYVAEMPNEGTDTVDFSAITTPVTYDATTTQQQNVHLNRSFAGQVFDVAIENVIGGTGNDTLTGNTLANILVGNDGNDTVLGSAGRDILIGGLGSDSLSGGLDDDVLIAGSTLSDASIAQLIDLQTEWKSANTYATRITNLRAGVGASLASLQSGVSVLDDSAAIDTLTGGIGTDWYFRALDDVISDLFAGEIEDLL